MKDILKEYGDVLLDASHIVDNPPPVISVSPKLDVALNGGIPEGCLFILTGPEKAGKDQPLHSLVYTPSGPKQMGEIKVGEKVVCPAAPDGTSTVIGVYPQGTNDVYRIYFKDGAIAECGYEHLWYLQYRGWANRRRVIPLKNLLSLAPEQLQQIIVPTVGDIQGKRIHRIEYVGEQKTQCIEIEHESGLYVTDGYTVTHNTVTALQTCRNAQKVQVEGGAPRKIFYGNVEGRLKKRDLEGIQGLDYRDEHFKIIGSTKGNILSGEKYLGVFDMIINQEPHSVVVVDSFSALVAESELVGDMTDIQVAAMNRYLGKFTRKFANVLPINRVTLIGITHLMANIQKMGRGKSKVEKSGNALKYAQDVKLWATHFTPLMRGDTQIGQSVHWIVMNSALGPPGQKVTSHIKYGRGIWNEYEAMELGKDFGIIDARGSWLSWNGHKYQGAMNFVVFLEENPNACSDLYEAIMEMVGIK